LLGGARHRPVDVDQGFLLVAELVDTAYDFANEVLKAQREFLHKAIQVTAPLYDRIEEQATEATKATARGRSRRRSPQDPPTRRGPLQGASSWLRGRPGLSSRRATW
jgi:hypothetical protein